MYMNTGGADVAEDEHSSNSDVESSGTGRSDCSGSDSDSDNSGSERRRKRRSSKVGSAASRDAPLTPSHARASPGSAAHVSVAPSTPSHSRGTPRGPGSSQPSWASEVIKRFRSGELDNMKPREGNKLLKDWAAKLKLVSRDEAPRETVDTHTRHDAAQNVNVEGTSRRGQGN